MIALLAVAAAAALTAGPTLEFAARSGEELRRLRDADLRSASSGERVAAWLAGIEDGNRRLATLARACPAAKHPAAWAALAAAASAVVAAQEGMLLALSAERLRLAAHGDTALAASFRGPPSPSCPVPRPLRWTRQPVLRHAEARAGFTAGLDRGKAKWRFEHTEARPL